MPGIVAAQTRNRTYIAKDIVQEISHSLFNADQFKKEAYLSDRFALAVSSLPSQHSGVIENEAAVVAWLGDVFFNNQTLGLESLDVICDLFARKKVKECIAKFEGQFQLIIYDKKQEHFFAAADKVSSHPFYYHATQDTTIITPEVLSLKRQFDTAPVVRKGAIFEFMMSGHLWGNGTFLKEVERIGPGQYLFNNQKKSNLNFYYKHFYTSASRSKSLDEYSDQLYSAIHKDMDRMPEGNQILTLSGGYDSRALLGFMEDRKMGIASISYSYGVPMQEESDAQVAKYYAKKTGVPFDYYQADLSDAAQIYRSICDVITATGGESDAVVAQDALLGTHFYKNLADDYDIILRGDEIWGWGDYAVNSDMAFIENYLLSPSEFNLSNKVLRQGEYEEALDYVESMRKTYADEYSHGSVNDVKDYLYWRHREARLLQNMAYFRRCYLNHQAPFLYDNTLQTIREIPWQYRIRKKHFKNMAKTCFPDLFDNFGVATAYKKGPDKYDLLYQNKEFAKIMRTHLLKEPPAALQQLLDTEEISNIFARAIRSNRSASDHQSEYNVKRFLNDTLRKSIYLPGLIKYGLKKMNKFHFPVSEKTYLYRLFVLALSLKQYENC